MSTRNRLAIIALCAALSACSGLPQDVARPVTHALQNPSSTELGAIVQQRRTAAKGAASSGFMLLSGPDDAYGSRLALAEGAEKTLDLQYYAIHADASTARLLESVVKAARRGVRVRVLLDDFHSTGRDAQVMRLAFEPNIEMRMFNPVAGPRASMLGRIFSSITDFSRVQQRMHNKLFIADNAMGVTGGRNLGDAYFGNAEKGNFVDLDVLAVGPVVADLSASFDQFWNNTRSYPVESLISEEDLLKMRETIRAEDAAKADKPADDATQDQARAINESVSKTDTDVAKEAADAPPAVTHQDVKDAQRRRAAQFKPMDLAHAKLSWAPAAVLADKPAKIAADGSTAPTPQDNQSANATGNSAKVAAATGAPERGDASSDGASKAGPTGADVPDTAQGETVVGGLLELMGQAKKDLLIVSPYFVPGTEIMKAFEDARARGVRVRVLTNSLASNDAPIAHAGYIGHREAVLKLGVELYEMRSEQAGLRRAIGLGGSGRSATGNSRAMLHSKVMVVDGRLLVIGSMNLDLRSELQNTEIALLIQSRNLSEIAGKQIQRGMQDLAWTVELDDKGLVWHAPKDSDLQDVRHEPDTSVMLRFLMRVLGPLAPDNLL